MAHANARLTEFGRLLLVQRILELGWPRAPFLPTVDHQVRSCVGFLTAGRGGAL